jgi:hypothetical protein
MTALVSARSTFILKVASDASLIDDFGLVAAFCRCLSANESCLLLRQCAVEASNLRDTLLRKVCDDVANAFLSAHMDLIAHLVDALHSNDQRFRQSAGYCLATLLPRLSSRHKKTILEAFLDSTYIGMRRRAYKWFSNDKQLPIKALTQVWHEYHDKECAWLIVKKFPIKFLIEHRAYLLSTLTEGWQFSRLYLRIAERRHELLSELQGRDAISYCYVLAKLGRGLSVKQAKSYIDSHATDDRFGLLVWSIGRLKLWPALQYIKKQLPAIEEKKMTLLRSRYGI